MAQHDYDIANQSGANFRADLNNALDAIVSNNSGSSEPSTTFAYEWWIDTSANVLKLRNSANNAWITLPLSITADNSTSGALTVNGNLSTTGTLDINGGELILDADADTSITADSDDQIDFKIGGTDVATLTNSHLVLKGTAPKITIGDGGEEDTALIFDGNAQDFYIGLDDSEDDLVIGTGSTVGTNAKVVLNSAGNFGIGQVPTRDLSIHAGDASSVFAHFTNTDTGTTSSDGVIIGLGSSEDLVLSNQESSKNIIFENGGSEAMRINSSNDAVFTGGITFGDSHTIANGAGDNLHITSGTSENIVIDSLGGITVISCNGSEAMRIDADGNLLLGTTTRIGNSNTIAKTTDHCPLNLRRDNGSSSNSILICIADTNTAKMAVRGDGDLENVNNSYGALSDERLKSNIVDANSQLEDIKKVKVRNYTLDSTGETHIGVIAQELEAEGMNGLVVEREEGYKGVKYSILFMKAIKAIQEQQTQIEALQSEINTLKGGE